MRPKQGEKGIGRLSAAFLSPITLLVSKKIDSSFVAVLVDWRHFENPYLLISDIEFPVISFADIKELPEKLIELSHKLTKVNLNDNRNRRIEAAWESFSELERQNGLSRTTYDLIQKTNYNDLFAWDHVIPWKLLMDKYKDQDSGYHGTALFALKAYHELACWVDSPYEDDDTNEIKKDLTFTLVNFIDPLSEHKFSLEYAVKLHEHNHTEKTVVSSRESFSIEEFRDLEHYIEGEFDEHGNFTGQIKAFGKELGTKTIYNKSINKLTGRDKLGSFKFCIGTVEWESGSTTHAEDEYEIIKEVLVKYGGICIYRDALRVMPYGRPGADLFEIEERRSKNAGRYFWSYRRSYGRVSFTGKSNPSLRDKAGREGLVDNKARRELERLVKNLLIEITDLYFGRESINRKNELPVIKKKNAARKRAAEKAAKKNKVNFRKALKTNYPLVIESRNTVTEKLKVFEDAASNNRIDILFGIKTDLDYLEYVRDRLILPSRPANLEDFEDTYLSYREAYREFCSVLDNLKGRLRMLENSGALGDPKEIAKNRFSSNESKLSSQISKAMSVISEHLQTIEKDWSEKAASDRKLYRLRSTNILDLIDSNGSLIRVLDMLDSNFLELKEEIEIKYGGISNSLEQIADDIDLEGAFLHAEMEAEKLTKKVEMLNSVAQLGISVEIIGHELEALESQVTKYLNMMPANAKTLTSFKLAYEAHKALVDRLRFLTPLKKTAYRNRIEITGEEISNYIIDFFKDIFSRNRINFNASESFRKIKIKDLPSRIYPTFINLINNSMYWVQKSDSRYISLDFINGKAIISDSGPGVSDDDLDMLFELFFTRRLNGRGIGLYLCRQNLAVARHKIWYAKDGDPKIHDGANFIIEFNGVADA